MRARLQHTKKRVTKSGPLESAMLLVAIIEPLMTIPQIIDIYRQPGANVSILTWVLYAIASIMWLLYGIRRRNTPLIVTGALWIIMEVLVIYGTAVYT